MLPRGIRNNNPLNIRRSKDQWQGLKAQQTDASFCQFESLDYGWRAAFYLLTRTYYHKYRLFTIRAIINKWAPPNENLTSTYIANVSRLTGSFDLLGGQPTILKGLDAEGTESELIATLGVALHAVLLFPSKFCSLRL